MSLTVIKRLTINVTLWLLASLTIANAAEVMSIVDKDGKKTITFFTDSIWEMDLDRDLLLYDPADLPSTASEIEKMNAGVKQKDPLSNYKLGLSYLKGGNGVSQSFSRAVELFEFAGSRGVLKARNTLGVMYARGQGVPQNFRNADMLLSGNMCKEAKFNIGYLQFWGVVSGNSLESLKDSALDGIGQAELYLALGYTRGNDYRNAYKWVLIALARDYNGIHSRGAKTLRDYLATALGPNRVAVEQHITESSFKHVERPAIGVIGPSESN